MNIIKISHKEITVALTHIKFMGVLTNCTIGPLGLKVGGGEACELKVRDASVVLTGRCSCTVDMLK